MNITQIKKQKMPITAEERAYLLNGISAVGQDRSPFARAQIRGNCQNESIVGEASFYHTPLGVLISVWIKGFEAKRQTYNIRIEENCARRRSACMLPPLYERGGYAFFSSLTGKLTPGEILNGKIIVSRYCACSDEDIAFGYIESVLSKKQARIV